MCRLPQNVARSTHEGCSWDINCTLHSPCRVSSSESKRARQLAQEQSATHVDELVRHLPFEIVVRHVEHVRLLAALLRLKVSAAKHAQIYQLRRKEHAPEAIVLQLQVDEGVAALDSALEVAKATCELVARKVQGAKAAQRRKELWDVALQPALRIALAGKTSAMSARQRPCAQACRRRAAA